MNEDENIRQGRAGEPVMPAHPNRTGTENAPGNDDHQKAGAAASEAPHIPPESAGEPATGPVGAQAHPMAPRVGERAGEETASAPPPSAVPPSAGTAPSVALPDIAGAGTRGARWEVLVAGVLAAALLGGGAATGTSLDLEAQQPPVTSTVRPANGVPPVVNNRDAATARASPSVVTISATAGASAGTVGHRPGHRRPYPHQHARRHP